MVSSGEIGCLGNKDLPDICVGQKFRGPRVFTLRAVLFAIFPMLNSNKFMIRA